MKDTQPARVRFGVFELDLKSGELCAGDEKAVLREQPLQILLMLVEREGEIVIREEIRKKLWPNDTIVEFDHSINAAIRILRRALGDSADDPKYIETLARRGYRLMVPVEWVGADDPLIPSLSPKPGEKAGAPAQALSPASVDKGPALSLSKGRAPAAQVSPAEGAAVRVQTEPGVLTGRTVSHYRVLNIIGGGGMGVVYRAEDLKLGRAVALKFLPEELGSDPQALERFSREARAASSLNHPNICTIYEFGEHEGQPFIVMELIEGQTLRDRLSAAAAQAKPVSLDELLDMAIQICDGLEAAHEKGIIHRDIKPANIFIANKGVAKILDFGLAKLLEGSDEDEVGAQAGAPAGVLPSASRPSHLSRTGVAMGTAGYMSPEQVRGEKLDARTDVFSFGLVLYEMATGRRAFTGETAAIVHDAIVNKASIPLHDLNSKLSPKLEGIITKALEKDRERRYQSTAEMRTDLERLRRGGRPNILEFPASGRWKWYAAAALLVAVAVGGWLLWRGRNTAKLTDQDTIVLADFVNTTGDPVLDDALTTAVRADLEQTPFLKLLAGDKVRATLKLLNHAEDAKLAPDLARDVCARTNSRALVAGSIADAGNHYWVQLKAEDCQTGRSIASVGVRAENRDQIVRMLGVAGRQLRSQLGEPQASLRKFNQPLEEATTSSLEALQAYTSGIKTSDETEFGAVPYFKRALALDPSFARAYVSLGVAYYNLRQPTLSIQNYEKAYELRDRASARQRLYIEAHYYGSVTGELEKTKLVYTEWAQMYPADPLPHTNLAFGYRAVGQYDKAVTEARHALRISPDNFRPVHNLMMACIALGRFDEAKNVFDEAQARNLNDPLLRLARYWLAFLQQDNVAMQEQVAWALGRQRAEELFYAQSHTEAYHGRLGKANELSQRAVDSATHANAVEAAAEWRVDGALREAEIGNTAGARKKATEALALSNGKDIQVAAALAFALAGDSARARALAKELDREFPLDTLIQRYWLPAIGAASEMQEGNASEALKLLSAAAPYELGEFGVPPNLYVPYLRGQAYLRAGQGENAAAEFRKVLNHPGIVMNGITGALSHLQLGRAQAMMGDKAAARKSYQDFLTLWKDADPDIPIFKQAKAEYAKLR